MLSRLSGLALMTVVFAGSVSAQTVDPSLFSGMKWRLVGPFRGGRSLAVAGSLQRPDEYYFGATGGGVWKTTDSGVTWKAVSDSTFGTGSVGAIAISPTNPDVVIAGTGEKDIRGNISHGDGLYRTDDGGKTWRRLGLADTQTISKIVFHPKNPDVIYVAALGHIYGKHPERGVYKTTDGGKNWTRILDGTLQAGAIDIELDPENPEVIVAALWEASRTPYSMTSGGPGSGLHKSLDGGKTWTNITRSPGLPQKTIGKIGITISPVDCNRYWAIIEAEDGGIFRSDDAGRTWSKINEDRNWRQRAWYYSHVVADPKAKDSVYVLNVGFGRSEDGGKTFKGIRTPHSDNHDLWIAPDNPKRMIEANDGGAAVSKDGGQTWTELTFPTAQFYHVSTDNNFPYRILGAQQDNSTIRILSRTEGFGIGEDDWTSTAGGESGYVSAKPDNADVVVGGSYGGSMSVFNHRTNISRSIDPWPDNPMGHGAEDLDYRFQWTYPILFSLHNPNLLFTCSQFVMTSNDLGQSWKKISGDLTRNDKSKMGPSGGPITKDNTSVEYYGTVFTLAESPVKRGVLWAGSDDGLIHVTQDGGKKWANVTPTGMPEWGLVSMIEASPFDAGTAYAALDNHENDDYRPYIYKTTDFGKSWTQITTGIPASNFLRVVREDKKQRGLLYAGTENGVYVSFNGGDRWQPLQLNLPTTPVHDIAWKEDDLVVATHGRSFWVLDDLSPLQSLAKDSQKKTRLYQPRNAYPIVWGSRGGANTGQNPDSGVVVNYYLEKDAKEVKIEFLDSKGKVFQSLPTSGAKAGHNKTTSMLRYPSWRSVPGMILWSGFPSPIVAPPGEYSVRLTVDGITQESKFKWLRDPRIPATDGDLQEKFRFLQEIAAKLTAAHNAVVSIRESREKLGKVNGTAELVAKLTKIEEAIYQTKNRSGQDPLNYPIRLNDKLAGVFSHVTESDFRPTAQSYEVFKKLSKELDAELKMLDSLMKNEYPKFVK